MGYLLAHHLLEYNHVNLFKLIFLHCLLVFLVVLLLQNWLQLLVQGIRLEIAVVDPVY